MDTHAALDKGNIGKMKPFSVFQYDVLSMNCQVTNMQWDVLNIVWGDKNAVWGDEHWDDKHAG